MKNNVKLKEAHALNAMVRALQIDSSDNLIAKEAKVASYLGQTVRFLKVLG